MRLSPVEAELIKLSTSREPFDKRVEEVKQLGFDEAIARELVKRWVNRQLTA